MSDTDDTDALLSCDPGGGLDQLLGGTMEGFSTSQLDSTTNTSSDKTTNSSSNNDTPLKPTSMSQGATSSASKKTIKKKNAKKKKAALAAAAAAAAAADAEGKKLESTLDVSDYFNSEGELVLSGLSQFSESSSMDKDCSSNSDNGKSSSSSDERTADSNTVVSVRPQPKSKDESDEKSGKISNTQSQSSNLSSTSNSSFVKVSPGSVPLDVQDNLKRQILEANHNNPKVAEMLEGNSTKVAYGVLNLNLNDLKTFSEGLNRSNFFPKEEKVSTFVPSKNEQGEQVFTRAPNFRTPGGYQPPKNPKPCRELTDDQIREEVRKMYAFPFIEEGDEEEGKKSGSSADPNSSSSGSAKKNTSNESDKLDSSKVEFNFLSNGAPIPNEFGKGKSGKPIKRKLLPFGGGPCGSTSGSIPDLGFGLRNDMNDEQVEVEEPPIDKTTTYTTGDKEDTVAAEESRPENKSHVSEVKSRFSFGYGDEDNLSPIRPTTGTQKVGSGSQDNSNSSVSHPRFQPSPKKSNSSGESSDAKDKTATNENSVDISATTNSEQEQESNSNLPLQQSITANFLGVPKKLSIPKRRLIRKAATKYRAMTSRTPEFEIVESTTTPPPTAVAADLKKILSEIDLPAEEMENLIENFSEDDADFADVSLFDEVDGNLATCLSELKLDMDSWKKSGSGKEQAMGLSTESYYAEKFKREQCEKELRSLHESFLTQKQDNAVLEGTLKRRNMMLVQITMAFNRVCKEWKKFDLENKQAVAKLQNDQKVLAAACKNSKERNEQYEKELHKTLEMADSFKTKVFDVQKERDEAVMVLKQANSQMSDRLEGLRGEVETLKNERDATLRALRESQVKLDESRSTVERLEGELRTVQEKYSEGTTKYDELLQAKSQQDANYLDVVERRNELEAMVMKLTTELNHEKCNKDQIRRDMHEEAERKTRAEAERLHEYYNKKVQEILKSATEEAARAEGVLKEQMKRAALESDRKLTECKEKCQRDVDTLRGKYEAELEKLKRENLHRQLLISSTVKQLQLGESSNLDLNTLTVPPSRPVARKDLFESLKAHNLESIPVFRPNNANSLSKFTLDHLPALSQEFGSGSFSRFKTSTPVSEGSNKLSSSLPSSSSAVLGVDLKTAASSAGGAGDYKNKQHNNNNDISFNSFLEKVCTTEKSKSESSSNSTDKSQTHPHSLSHLLDAPVKPEKEQQQQSLQAPAKVGDANSNPQVLDPALQKCIQELLRSYADKFQQDSVPQQCSPSTQAQLSSVPNHNNINNVSNKSDVESSNRNGELGELGSTASASTQQASHGSQDCRQESRKAKANKEQQPQQSSSNKPPWK